MPPRRHLPIAGQKPAPAPGTVPAPGEGEDRPAWHWSCIGALLILVFWLPLAMLGQWLARGLAALLVPGSSAADTAATLARSSPATRALVGFASTGPLVLSLVVAFGAGGALVGRYGAPAGRREAGAAGLAAATAAWGLTAASAGSASAAALLWPPLAILGALVAFAAGAWGQRKRPRASS